MAQPKPSLNAAFVLQTALELARDEGRDYFRLRSLLRNLCGGQRPVLRFAQWLSTHRPWQPRALSLLPDHMGAAHYRLLACQYAAFGPYAQVLVVTHPHATRK